MICGWRRGSAAVWSPLVTVEIRIGIHGRGGWRADVLGSPRDSRRFERRDVAERWAQELAKHRAEDVEILVRDAYQRVIRRSAAPLPRR